MKDIPSVIPEGFPLDDWKRELTEEEICRRLHRVGGDCLCEVCGNPFYDHPDETRENALDWDGYSYLKRLCFGWLGKL
jgi:hypothetical protein